MRFLFMFTIDVLRTSQKRHPLDVTLEHLQEVFGAFLQKPKNYKTATSLVSQAHIWWNKIKNNAVKMLLY